MAWSTPCRRQGMRQHRPEKYAGPKNIWKCYTKFIAMGGSEREWEEEGVLTVAMQIGKLVLHWWHESSIIWRLHSQIGHSWASSWYESSVSLIPFGAFRTIASILFAYFWSIWLRYSDRINIEAYENAAFWNPTRWHSITVEVSMGTVSVWMI